MNRLKFSLLIFLLGVLIITTTGFKGCPWNKDDDDDDVVIGSSGVTLAAPSDLVATAVTSSQIDLSWTDNANNEDDFKIERKTGVIGVYAEIEKGIGTRTSYTSYSDTGLVSGITYYYRVRAYNTNGYSMYSNEASATTSPFTLGTPADATINIDLTGALSPTRLPVSWFASANVVDYLLEICNDDNFIPAHSVYSPTLAANITQHLVPTSTLMTNTWYYWRVTAHHTAGETVAANAPFSFYTGATGSAPGTFALEIPADDASGISLTPQLIWTNATSETAYTLNVSDTNRTLLLYTRIIKPGVLTDTIPAAQTLSETSRYYWHVVAANPFGTTDSGARSFVTGPIEYYELTADTTTITAGDGITVTLTAYDNDELIVTFHTPFSITMNAGAGLTYYTDNTFSTVNASRQYTVTNGVANIYVRATAAGALTLISTDIATRITNSSAITVNPDAASSLTFTTQPVTKPTSATIPVEVTVRDEYNNPVAGADVYISVNKAALNGTTVRTSNTYGIAIFNDLYILVADVNYTLSVTTTGVSAVSSNAFDITAVPNSLSFVTQPTTQTAGASIPVEVMVKDEYNNPVGGAGVAISVNKAGLNGTKVRSSGVNGVAIFNDLNITVADINYTLSVTTTGVSAVSSNAFDITGAVPNSLAFTTQPTTQTAGATIPVEVMVKDEYNNLVAGADVYISVNKAGLNGTKVRISGDNGVATFNDLNISVADINYTLSVTTTGVVVVTSNAFDITAAVASSLAFTTQPTTQTAGATIPVGVTVRDEYNNLVAGAAVYISVNKGTLNGTRVRTSATNGVAAFNDLNILVADVNYTLSVTTTGVSAVASNPFDITAAVPNSLTFVQAPTNAVAGDIIPVVTVRVDDQYSNVVAGVSVSVTVTTAAQLNGTTTQVSNASGIATFADLMITSTGTYALSARAGAVGPQASADFDIFAVVPNSLSFTTQPITKPAGATIPVVVIVRDEYNNVVGGAAVYISVDKAALNGTTVKTSDSYGIATFYNLNITVADVNYTLSVTTTGVSAVTSNLFDITAAPYSLTFFIQPLTKTAGATIPVVVLVEDEYNNPVAAADVYISVNKANLNGTRVRTSVANGMATFNDLNITVADVNYTLSVTTTGVGDVISEAFDITVAPANTLTFITQPATTTAGADITPAVTVEVKDQYNNLVAGIGVSLTSSAALLNGTTTRVSDDSGIATFADLNITTTGYYVITATYLAITQASDDFGIAAGPAVIVDAVTGANTLVSAGSAEVYTATSKDANGNPASESYAWTWTTNDTGSVTQTGTTATFTGFLAGNVTITATGDTSAKAKGKVVTVDPGAIASLTVSGADTLVSAGDAEAYTGASADANGNAVAEDYTWTWTTNDTGSVTQTGTTSTFTGFLVGNVTITATGDTSGVAKGKVVTVNAGPAVTVNAISGANTITSAGSAEAYTTTSKDVNGNTATETYTWSHTDDTGSVTRTDNSLVGFLVGNVTITATGDTSAIAEGQVVTVTLGAIASLTVSGANTITSAGSAEVYTGASADANGNAVSETYTWTHTDDTGSVTRTVNSLVGFLAGNVTITATGNTSAIAKGKVVTVNPAIPTVTTQAVTDYASTTATGNGNITNTGGENCTARGFKYGLTETDTWSVSESGSFVAESYTLGITELDPGTQYYIRAYATNSAGTGYGSYVSLTTKPAAPTGVAATDGTATDKVTITWTKSTGATGYQVYRDGTALGWLGDVATCIDTGADAPTITPGSAAASDGTSTAQVVLSLSGPSANNGTTHNYKVRARNATGESADSATNTGYRGVGTLTYQWQRSAGDSDADYTDISGATTAGYNDTDAPFNAGGRYYKCVENATGATQQISSANRGYRGLTTVTRNFTGAVYNWPVPAGVTSISVDCRGAKGGYGSSSGDGVNGARVQTTLTVTSLETLNIYVGGQGVDGSVATGGAGGWNGGGNGGNGGGANTAGGGGGGASDIRLTQGAITSTDYRIVVAGGGAGGGYNGDGGVGGQTNNAFVGTAGDGTGGTSFGKGGSNTAGGAAGTNGTDGSLGYGGTGGVGGIAGSYSYAGGGGGGGYYGGGGGGAGGTSSYMGSGGGGGSSNAYSGTDTSYENGVQSGNGQIIIYY